MMVVAWTLRFNRSLSVECAPGGGSRRTRGPDGPGSAETHYVVRWMTKRRRPPRFPEDPPSNGGVTADRAILVAQCHRDQNNGGASRDDPAFRLGASDGAGTLPVYRGLASQPTLLHLVVAGRKRNADVLRGGLARFARWRRRPKNGGRLPKQLVIDLDHLPAS